MIEGERLLVEKAKNGDIGAFERLIESYQKKVYNIAFRMMGNQYDASELAQEAFIRMFKSIGSFKEQAAFSTWIYRITTNVCLDALRKRKDHMVISLDQELPVEEGEIKRQIEDNAPGPEEQAERKEIRKALYNAINSLSPEHRIAMVMRDIQGFSYEEISKILQCPEGTVKSRINRARHTLKEILQSNKELFEKVFVK